MASARPRLTLVVDSPAEASAPVAAESFGELSGVNSARFSTGSRIDPDAYRRAFPDRWSAFLRAHHRDATEVAFFYGVTDRAARDWWEGRSAPRGSVVAQAHAVFGDAGKWLAGVAA